MGMDQLKCEICGKDGLDAVDCCDSCKRIVCDRGCGTIFEDTFLCKDCEQKALEKIEPSIDEWASEIRSKGKDGWHGKD